MLERARRAGQFPARRSLYDDPDARRARCRSRGRHPARCLDAAAPAPGHAGVHRALGDPQVRLHRALSGQETRRRMRCARQLARSARCSTRTGLSLSRAAHDGHDSRSAARAPCERDERRRLARPGCSRAPPALIRHPVIALVPIAATVWEAAAPARPPLAVARPAIHRPRATSSRRLADPRFYGSALRTRSLFAAVSVTAGARARARARAADARCRARPWPDSRWPRCCRGRFQRSSPR